MSRVLAEFLQQFFTFIFTAMLVVSVGGKLAWVLLLFVPFIVFGCQDRPPGAHTTRRGQDKLAEIQNILHETISGNRIVKAFNMEVWETTRFQTAAKRLFSGELALGGRAGDQFSADGYSGAVAIALLLSGPQQHQAPHSHHGRIHGLHRRRLQSLRAGAQVRHVLQQFSAGARRFGIVFKFMDAQDVVREKPHARKLPAFHDSIRFEDVRFSYADGEDAREVLKDINLSEAGEMLALVGGSGAGNLRWCI